MENDNSNSPESYSTKIGMSELETTYLSLRIGEEIPHLKVKEIKKITNAQSSNNLPGVDYKFIIVSEDDELLTINSWVFWNALRSVIQTHKNIPNVLSLKHIAEKIYEISVVE